MLYFFVQKQSSTWREIALSSHWFVTKSRKRVADRKQKCLLVLGGTRTGGRGIVSLQSAAHPSQAQIESSQHQRCAPGPVSHSSVQELVEGGDVALGHLQGLVFGELLLAAETGQHGAQLVERVVQAEHAAPLARVGRQPALLHHHRV